MRSDRSRAVRQRHDEAMSRIPAAVQGENEAMDLVRERKEEERVE